MQVQAGSDADHLRPHRTRHGRQLFDVNGVPICIDRRLVDIESIQTGCACTIMRDMTTDRWRRDDHGIARLRKRHECVEIGHGPGRHPDLGISRSEHLGRELGCDDLDLLNRFEAHLVLLTRISKRRPRAKPSCEDCLCPGIHHIGCWVQVDAFDLVYATVLGNQLVDPSINRCEFSLGRL